MKSRLRTMIGCIAAVGGLEADVVPLGVVALHRRLVVDHRDHDVAAVGVQLLAHEDEVAVEDAVLDHRVALHPQREHLARLPDEEAVDLDRVLDVLDGEQRRAGGDPPDQRHVDHVFLAASARAPGRAAPTGRSARDLRSSRCR